MSDWWECPSCLILTEIPPERHRCLPENIQPARPRVSPPPSRGGAHFYNPPFAVPPPPPRRASPTPPPAPARKTSPRKASPPKEAAKSPTMARRTPKPKRTPPPPVPPVDPSAFLSHPAIQSFVKFGKHKVAKATDHWMADLFDDLFGPGYYDRSH